MPSLWGRLPQGTNLAAQTAGDPMKKSSAISIVLVAFLGSSCGSDALKSGGGADSAAGGQSGSPGGTGSGGAEAGGGTLGKGGAGAGASGGKGGSNTGGQAAGGTAGIVCPPSGPCPYCPNGSVVNPSDPCACPVCILPDAGIGKDATTDACPPLPCPLLICPAGSTVLRPECGCATCVPGDAGPTDAPACPPTCPAAKCAYGTIFDSCGCPNCVLPDAGAGDATTKDAPADVCPALPCAYPLCPAGYSVVDHPCACPTCEPVDAGQSDGRVCPPIACPDIMCAGGMVPNPSDPCGCPVCGPLGTDAGRSDCAGLDECSCRQVNGCGVIAETCYCPYPKCGPNGACICGGGKFVGCAPVQLTNCAAAKARVAAMCPSLSGQTFATVCDGADSLCATKCLDDATACSDVRCSFCDSCDCVADPFSACLAKCKTALAN
jgi:hypothetical protein